MGEKPIAVTKADREAAAAWVWPFVSEKGEVQGEWLTNLVSAFAHHRTKAIAEERAAVVAWMRDLASKPEREIEEMATLVAAAEVISRGDHTRESDTRRMAETAKTGSVRSTGSAVREAHSPEG